ncbi:MAG TPA: hypothetical protein VN929_02410 [Burkholderiales bacterium]|nr:hypothetical protein [Burkholderiales bacterium]
MSDLEIGKKEEERIALDYFLDAYAFTTGAQLEYIPFASDGERPDFLCRTAAGEVIGVEITRVMVRPHIKGELIALGASTRLNALAASEAVFAVVEEKDRKRRSLGWRLPENTILVIHVLDTDVDELGALYASANLHDDFADFGFREIWIADCGSIEAYGGVTLIGLHPEQWWGPHERWNHFQKPYG